MTQPQEEGKGKGSASGGAGGQFDYRLGVFLQPLKKGDGYAPGSDILVGEVSAFRPLLGVPHRLSGFVPLQGRVEASQG